MWQYNNVHFRYDNPVGSVHGQETTVPYIRTYKKSKYALIQALEMYTRESYLGEYTEIDTRTIKHDSPIKI